MITFVGENEIKDIRIGVQDEKLIAYDKYVKWFIHYKSVDREL